MSKQYWRLLELGECVQRGDEYHLKGEGPWVSVEVNDIGDVIDHGHVPFRRRITITESQGWISVKERMPTKEDANKQWKVLWFRRDGGHVYPQSTDWNGYGEWFTHWMSIPDDPEPEVDAELEAFQKWFSDQPDRHYTDQVMMKKCFLAGRKSVATEGGQS